MYFDAANEGALDPKQFWNGLGLLDAGSEEEKLRRKNMVTFFR